jgi:hypothetical protein
MEADSFFIREDIQCHLSKSNEDVRGALFDFFDQEWSAVTDFEGRGSSVPGRSALHDVRDERLVPVDPRLRAEGAEKPTRTSDEWFEPFRPMLRMINFFTAWGFTDEKELRVARAKTPNRSRLTEQGARPTALGFVERVLRSEKQFLERCPVVLRVVVFVVHGSLRRSRSKAVEPHLEQDTDVP